MKELRVLGVVVFGLLGLAHYFFGAIKLTFLCGELDLIVGH